MNNSSFLVKDLIQGDTSVLERDDFSRINPTEIREALDILSSSNILSRKEKEFLMLNSWKIYFRVKPPSIEEFLTEEWIGPTARNIYPHVRKILCEFWKPDSKYRNFILASGIGTGKAQPLNAKVYTPDGYKLIGDLHVGDKVMSPEGENSVTGVYPQGKKDIYEIEFKDGVKVRCCDDHLWEVKKWVSWNTELKKTGHFDRKITLSLKEIKKQLVYNKDDERWLYPKVKPNKYRFPTSIIDFKEKEHILHPYILGVLIGDGSITSGNLCIDSADIEVIEKVKALLPVNCFIEHRDRYSYIIKNWTSVPNFGGKNKYNLIKKELKRLGLYGRNSGNKFIPDDYLYDSAENRIELLRGLCDTDGTVDKRGYLATVGFSNEKLIDQTKWLVESLGGIAKKSSKIPKLNGTPHKEHFILTLNLPQQINPFSLKRKAKIYEKRKFKYPPIRIIKSIRYVGNEEAQCISLNKNVSQLYFTNGLVITHNTTLSVICSLFCTVHLFCMRNPHRFFNIAESASFVNMLVSFTEDKAKQLLVQPFYRIMETSIKFHRVRQEEKLIGKQEEDYPDKICWTSAGKIGCMQFYNDIHYAIGSSPNKFLGLSLMSAIITEISFFMERGFSADYIWRTYQDCKGRVKSRFFGRYLSHTILDSSPNDIEESPIDDYIFGNGNAYLDPTNYIVTGTQWDFLGDIPLKYPVWQKTGETFPVFKGTTTEPSRLLGVDEKTTYSKETIYNVPIDLKESFVEDCLKSVKDFCGWPGGSVDKLIKDNSVIEKMFYPNLKNFYSFVHAPIEQVSKDLLWDLVKDKFFIDHGTGGYEFYRSPSELRFAHIDQAETKDHAGISFVHPELALNGEIVYVTDFTIDISPGKSKINLDAIRIFIEDLRNKGKFKIKLLSFDQYQSSATIDYLKGVGINAIKQSVERDINIYRVYISMINSGRVKVGRNIILKNNLKSLQEVKTRGGKRKVDHQKGKLVKEDKGKWDQSKIGLYAKDLTDSHCGAIWNAIHNYVGVPKYTWIEPDLSEGFDKNDLMKNRVADRIYKKYGLRILPKK